jgi:bifunctional non-homologous end joining protein LigD
VPLPECVAMALVSMNEPWDDPDWIFELKYDGFRSLASVDAQRTRLVSRKNVEYKRYRVLEREISAAFGGHEAVLDGEIVCLDAEGRPQFYDLLYSRSAPYFAAFDLLWLDGQDLRALPLLERKRRLQILVSAKPGLLYVRHFERRGTALFKQVCRMDLSSQNRNRLHTVWKRAGSRSRIGRTRKQLTVASCLRSAYPQTQAGRTSFAST